VLLCLFTAVGVVGDVGDVLDVGRKFPAPPRPNEIGYNKESELDSGVGTQNETGRKTRCTHRALGYRGFRLGLGWRGGEGEFEFRKVESFPSSPSRSPSRDGTFRVRRESFFSAGGDAFGGGYEGIGAVNDGRRVVVRCLAVRLAGVVVVHRAAGGSRARARKNGGRRLAGLLMRRRRRPRRRLMMKMMGLVVVCKAVGRDEVYPRRFIAESVMDAVGGIKWNAHLFCEPRKGRISLRSDIYTSERRRRRRRRGEGVDMDKQRERRRVSARWLGWLASRGWLGWFLSGRRQR
jgi:hypothetical protein